MPLKPLSIKYKFIVSIVFGGIGCILNFYPISVFDSATLEITLLPGLFFPLLIALTWGWRYGLLSALAGGCQTMWWTWQSDGYGLLYSVPMFTLWIVWHGFWADFRRAHPKHSWLSTSFLVEIPFRISASLGFYTIFSWLVSLNTFWWAKDPVWTAVPADWISLVVFKHFVTAYILLLLTAFFLEIPWLRSLAGLDPRSKTNRPIRILGGSLGLGLGLCLVQDVIRFLAFNPDQTDFVHISMWVGGGQGFFTGSLYIIASLAGGMFFNRLLDERSANNEQIDHLNRILQAIRNVNQLITQEKNPAEMLNTACKLLVETRGYRTAWIAPTDQENMPRFFKAGFNGNFKPMAAYLEEGNEPFCLRELRQKRGVIVKDRPLDTCKGCPLSATYGQRVAMAVRIGYQDLVYGILVVSVPSGFHLDPREHELLQEIAGDLGYALYTLAMRHVRERLAMAVHDSTDGVIMASADHAITYVNPAFESQCGYFLYEIMGKDARTLGATDTDSSVRESLYKNLEARRSWQGTLVKTKKDGTNYLSEVSVNPVYDSEGNLDGFISWNRDITTKRKLEEQVARGQKLDSVGRMAGGIAHDINNLLTPILGFIELLKLKMPKDDPNQRFASEILKAGMQSRDLIGRLLAFARRETMELRPLVLSRIIKDMDFLLRKTLTENIRLVVDCTESKARIMGDPGRLEQIFMNLAVNARDAMPDGGMLIVCVADIEIVDTETTISRGIKPGRYVNVQVDDDGCGMEKETQEKIFEPFFTTKSGQPGSSGTGLGLATTYGIVREHCGAINVYSDPGCGTTFSLYFPICEQAEKKVIQHPASSLNTHGIQKVLLVEDEELVRKSIIMLLEHCGIEVFEASSSEHALELIEELDHVDLLFTDVVMPGMNGTVLSENLRKKFPGLRTLFMSGHTRKMFDSKNTMQQGCSFIHKPFTIHELKNKLYEMVP
ncbi:ATP-binding protein [Desulfoplanes sp.]